MHVYRKRPNGLSIAELRSHASTHTTDAAIAAGSVVAGIVLIGLVGAPYGALWLILGVGLLASVFRFVATAGRSALQRPALVLTGRPAWDGTRRTSWIIVGSTGDAVEPGQSGEAVAARLVGALTSELGEPLTAADDGPEGFRGIAPSTVFDHADHPVVVAWGVGQKAKLAATGDRAGIWIRIEPVDSDAERKVTVLSSDGRAAEVLDTVAWRL